MGGEVPRLAARLTMTSLSIIVPALDEAGQIVAVLARLAPLRLAGAQVILADGGSTDRTVALALPLVDLVVHAPRGRALQMNAGAALASGDALLFLHADTVLPEQAGSLILSALRERVWGRFDVRLAGSHRMLPVIAAMMNRRSRLSGIATGDQAIFVRRAVFEQLAGYAPIALMEDLELSRRLKKISRPACLRERVTSSGRRWEKHGVWRTIVLMWRLRLAYFLGADPRALAIAYGYLPR
ncbi:Glycosyl transferase, family 2 [Oxalobacteraceae bacterium IMCC9480]|nr:Glycosyl transferase, family 2 [Oxalobacteraceae bacterium IMCC9480]